VRRDIISRTAFSALTVLGSIAVASPAAAQSVGGCGYTVQTGTYATWPGGYQGWVKVTNVAGQVATDFSLLVDVGNTKIASGALADYSPADGGYQVDAPSWLQWQRIPRGASYTAQFNGAGTFNGITAYVLSINGQSCDTQAPQISLSASSGLVTSAGTVTLTAQASDDVAVRKVVFQRDGVEIGVDRTAPYTLDVPVSSALNGRHEYTAIAYDPTGNVATDAAHVLVAIDNRYVGTAVRGAADYATLLDYFDQITPENAGKWGSVEATRDVMTWGPLDEAYEFAQANGLPFRLHTLVWGQQQPAWLAALSPAEQLAEVDEWMAALAARYPDVDWIDVVNEPLHAVPSYAEALGGTGATGYDWVLTAFEMARAHFPDAELHLNDYQVEVMQQFTLQYLEIIELLQAQGSIDGIGIQGHFLERADVSEVESNLALLADTGLPIHVTEFDVNFEDDARHANVYRDLFSVFWDNPSVLGVTNWGFREGAVWQANSHLLESDGTPRPALDWLTCFVAGKSDCSVPEYVPAPWIGDEYGVTLEAELYDEASGVLAAGSAVAFADAGDYLSYTTVRFDPSWNSFAVTYLKGNTEVGSISLHLDALEAEPLLTVPLAPTGGWGTAATIEVPFPSVSGDHTLFVRFNDVFGVANVDSFRIGKPAPEGDEILANGDFETDAAGWYTWDGAVSTTTARAYQGARSLVVTGSSAIGPAATELVAAVQPGETYDISARVSIGGDVPGNVSLTWNIICDGAESFNTVATVQASGSWVPLTASFTMPNCTQITKAQLYFERQFGQSSPVADLYLDAVSVRAQTPSANLLPNGDFEASSAGWYTWNGAVSTSTERAHGGASSLVVTGSSAIGPAATDILGVIQAGQSYGYSAWLSLGGSEPGNVAATFNVICDGVESFNFLGSTQVTGGWANLAGTIELPAWTAITKAQHYFERQFGDTTPSATLYLDDVALIAR
jgi:GH35 family endo-1,4-beta-xylanase